MYTVNEIVIYMNYLIYGTSKYNNLLVMGFFLYMHSRKLDITSNFYRKSDRFYKEYAHIFSVLPLIEFFHFLSRPNGLWLQPQR